MKLYQYLEKLFGRRIVSNAEIPVYLTALSQQGRLDEPKKLAIMIELCRRISVLEDQKEPSVHPEQISWLTLRQKAVQAGVFKPRLKRAELEALIAQKSYYTVVKWM